MKIDCESYNNLITIRFSMTSRKTKNLITAGVLVYVTAAFMIPLFKQKKSSQKCFY